MGSATAPASMGADTTQVRTVSVDPKSAAMSPSDTARMVNGNDVANTPTRQVIRTHR